MRNLTDCFEGLLDAMKSLSLKENKWPGLGKIVIVPNGIPASSAPGLCLIHPRSGMIAISGCKNNAFAEYENGWTGRFVSRASTELNCL